MSNAAGAELICLRQRRKRNSMVQVKRRRFVVRPFSRNSAAIVVPKCMVGCVVQLKLLKLTKQAEDALEDEILREKVNDQRLKSLACR